MNINECGCQPYGWLDLDGNRCIRVIPRHLQVHLFGVMFHGGPVRLGEEWGSPSEVKIVLTGINSAGVLEISAEDAC